MKTFTERSNNHSKRRTAPKAVDQRQARGPAGLLFEDSRAEAVAQRQLKSIIQAQADQQGRQDNILAIQESAKELSPSKSKPNQTDIPNSQFNIQQPIQLMTDRTAEEPREYQQSIDDSKNPNDPPEYIELRTRTRGDYEHSRNSGGVSLDNIEAKFDDIENPRVDNICNEDLFEGWNFEIGQTGLMGSPANARKDRSWYEGLIDSGAGSYTATDLERERNEPLHHSDAIWRLYKMAFGEDEEGITPTGKLKRISHIPITSDRTLNTIWHTQGGHEALVNDDGQITYDNPADEDFIAMVGTPNVNSAAHLISDHGSELGIRRIRQITFIRAGRKIDIDLDLINAEAQDEGGGSSGRSRGCCFITTACTQARGLPDNCEELETLRAFRDDYIIPMEMGPELIQVYYRNSPKIVAAIDARQDVAEIYDRLYAVIQQCVRQIQRGDHQAAFKTYVNMVIQIRDRFTPEVEIPQFF